MRVKICGITNIRDACDAAALGADALGFIFARGPRQVTPEKVRQIIADLPPLVQTVGVFVNEKIATIKDIMSFCSLDLIQLHGSESPDICRLFMPRVIKAFRMKHETSWMELRPYLGEVRGCCLDSFVAGKQGGTGRTFDWSLALKAKAMGMPVILSGGLKATNIEQAICTVAPYAVDVNSGVEKHPGKKSAVLMKELMKKIRKKDDFGIANQ